LSTEAATVNRTQYDTDIGQQFVMRGWSVLDKFVPPIMCSLVSRYIRMKAKLDGSSEGHDHAVGPHEGYGDLLIESLGEILLPRLESILGEELWPTYGYYRLYKNGAKLAPHIDRIACEVSLSLCLGHHHDKKFGEDFCWPIWFRPLGDDEKITAEKSLGAEVRLRVGDAVLYKGCDLVHWREPLEGDWQAQAFLHYVRKSAPYSDIVKYDGRDGLGRPSEMRDPIRAEKMKRIDTFQKWVCEKQSEGATEAEERLARLDDTSGR
jgi:hypothetical protein